MSDKVERLIQEAVADLVRLERINGSCFVNLPLLYPDGSSVTVKIDQMENGLRVSDAGFAYREIEDVDAARSFKRIANKVAEDAYVSVGDRVIFVDVQASHLDRAIRDVAEVSWRVADQVCNRAFDEDEEALTEELNAKLIKIFGEPHVVTGKTIIGASTNEWPVSAVVSYAGHDAVFQAVANHANSVYRTSTAFRDLASLTHPPRLVAVVPNKSALGSRLALLAPGRVIERGQTDDLFLKAAA